MNSDSGNVVITGLGPVTSIGVGAEDFWTSLAAGRSNVHRRTLPVDLGRTAELPLASMPAPDQIPGLPADLAFLESEECGHYRDLGYAVLATELALADAGLEYDRDRNNIGAVQAFEAPGVERSVSALFELLSHPLPDDGPPPVYDLLAPYFYNMQAFLYVHLLGKALGLHGFSTSVHNACTSGAFALEVAAGHIRSGQAEVMVVAGGEAFDTAVRLEWFRRLEMYARDKQMRPFDAEASGFYVGEGAAAIILESAAHASRRGAAVYAEYLGGRFAQQSWKQTIPDVRGARLGEVITRALEATAVSAAELDLIVPHGAATQIGDGYEAACLEQALDGKAGGAVATAFKPYVGHMLAGSGIIELLCAALAIKHQAVPATLHTRPDQARLCVPLANTHTERRVDTVLKLTTGFTGHDAAQLLRRMNQ